MNKNNTALAVIAVTCWIVFIFLGLVAVKDAWGHLFPTPEEECLGVWEKVDERLTLHSSMKYYFYVPVYACIEDDGVSATTVTDEETGPTMQWRRN